MTGAPLPRPRGFAALPRDYVREIARRGGQRATALGRAHRFTSAEAAAAGRKGGAATHASKLLRAALGPPWETDSRPLWQRALDARGGR